MSSFVRNYVYATLDKERAYQDRQHGGREHDREHSVSDWISFMQDYLTDAAELCRHGEEKLAKEELRKVVALGIACFEVYGCPQRI
jgi:hypothetical protein